MVIKGYKQTEEHKMKRAEAHRGKKLNPESIAKRTATRRANGNYVAWNKGLMKETDNRVRKYAEKKIGRQASEITREKLSKSHKGQIAWNKGKEYLQIRGDKHFNWKGDKSEEKYGYEFTSQLKEAIRKRDSYRCQQCFRHQDELFTTNRKGQVVKRKLCIHHIDYNKLNNKSENLISLCGVCHAQTGYDRNDWTDYLKSKIENI